MAAAILLISMLVLVVAGMPVAFALGVASVLTALALGLGVQIVFLKMADGMDNFSLTAIPFFVLAGVIMSKGGMAKRLVDFANLLVGWVRGGLAMGNIVASMFFGGISGSSVADTSSIGSILIPMMEEKGYDRDFAVNVTITSSTQGIIIPPSHNAIIYALAASGVVGGAAVSIADVFMAGIIPGVLVGVSLMVVAYAISRRRGYPKERMVPLKEALRITREALLGLVTALIIVGGVIFGIFTATEASAVAVVYASCITFFVYRDIGLRALPGIFAEAVKTTAIVMLLIGTSSAFGFFVAYLNIPKLVAGAFASVSSNRIVVLIMINVVLLALGTMMDMAPLILITTPIFLPIVHAAGVSPVHFGIVMMLNLGIGLCTPPVGSTLFVGCAVGKISIEKLMRSIWPFYGAMIAVLVLVTYVPPLTTWIPSLMAG